MKRPCYLFARNFILKLLTTRCAYSPITPSYDTHQHEHHCLVWLCLLTSHC
ncbi:hypothetical protein MUK42_31230 [Musa troglodytarum]|uniref:Uncharacterized protein n=1 Tax=Musa troglodytarum TaxID=320322 RepID=A0A9E7FJZ4_9LILI|nr:hypothetical protein MUK42_31230 [Musa troglodytarum]